MSHNAKYYRKRLHVDSPSGQKKIRSLKDFGFTKTKAAKTDESAEVVVLVSPDAADHTDTSRQAQAEVAAIPNQDHSTDASRHARAEVQADTDEAPHAAPPPSSPPMDVVTQPMATGSTSESATQSEAIPNQDHSTDASRQVRAEVQADTDEAPHAAPPPSSPRVVTQTMGTGSTSESATQSEAMLNPGKKKYPGAGVIAKYEHEYNWLYYSVSRAGLMYKYCELLSQASVLSTNQQNPFVQGTALGDHPHRKLNAHDGSNVHKEACRKYIMSKGSEAHGKHGLFPTLTMKNPKMVSTNRDYMKALIDTIMLVICNRWALDKVSDVMEHLDMLQSKPVNTFKAMNKTLGYTSSTSITSMVDTINSFFEKKLLADIEKADFITVLADESTDEANRTQFAVMVRMLTRSTESVQDHFLGLVQLKRSDAATLMEAIETLLRQSQVDIKKVMFVGFDGCNTMSGELKGVQRRFRHVVPHSLYIHCRSHRLALCVKHLMKDFPVLGDVDEVLLAVYKLFEYSPQKFAVFKDVQSAYEKRELVLIRAAATRWLSHGRACKRFIDRYVQIIDSLDAILERTRQPEVVGVRDMVTNKNTLAAIAVLSDMLDPVNYFCKYLQGSVDFSQVSIKLKELIDALEGLATRFRGTLDDNNTDLTLSRLPQLFEEIDERTVYIRRIRNQNVYTQEQVVHVLACPMVNKLIGELQDGFHTSPVLSAFSIFNLNNLPETMTELVDYGKESIETLNSHYGERKDDLYAGHRTQAAPQIDRQTVSAEFDGFKHIMFLTRNRNQGQTTADMFQEMLEDERLRTTYSSMFKLLLLSRLIPSSTASVERLFSLMNSLCTKDRNRLGQNTLTSLMRLCCLGRKTLTDIEKDGIIDLFRDTKSSDINL